VAIALLAVPPRLAVLAALGARRGLQSSQCAQQAPIAHVRPSGLRMLVHPRALCPLPGARRRCALSSRHFVAATGAHSPCRVLAPPRPQDPPGRPTRQDSEEFPPPLRPRLDTRPTHPPSHPRQAPPAIQCLICPHKSLRRICPTWLTNLNNRYRRDRI